MLSSKNVFYILRTHNEMILIYFAYIHNKYIFKNDRSRIHELMMKLKLWATSCCKLYVGEHFDKCPIGCKAD